MQNTSLTAEEADLLTPAVLDVMSAAAGLVREGVVTRGGVGSLAEAIMCGEGTAGPHVALVSDAHTVMLVTMASARDHARLYVRGVQLGIGTVSLATLVRAGLENMSRTSYLMGAEAFGELAARLGALSRHDAVYPARAGGFDDLARTKRHLDALAELGLVVSPLPSAEELVKMLLRPMLTADAADAALRGVYSQLSGVTHGNALSLESYHVGDGELEYPRRVAVQHCAYLYAAACSIGDAAIHYFGIHPATRAGWNATRDAGTAAIGRFHSSPTRSGADA